MREASAKRDFHAAECILSPAIEADPGNPDLLCERAILNLYTNQVSQAFELVPLSVSGVRFKELARMICEHMTCRLLADPADFEAASILDLMRAFYKRPITDVGIRISACLIVKNEEANLERCLQSLVGAVHEIVVIDTGSTDNTIEIAQRYRAVIGHFPWCDDFSAARNKSLELATGNWALWIDADEELVPESLPAIKRAVTRPFFGGYDIEIVSFTGGTENGSQFRHCATRLFRRIDGVKFTGKVHEQVLPSLDALHLPWARLSGAYLLHHGYQPQIMEAKGKVGRMVGLLENEVREDPTSTFQWFNLANAYLVAGRLAEAEHAARRCVAMMPAGAPYCSMAYSILAQAASNAGRTSAALAACAEAELAGCATMPVIFEKCQALLRENRPDDAIREADRLLEMSWPEGLTGDRSIFTHKRLVLRGQILAVLGRFDESLASLDAALNVDPYFTPALYSKGAVLEKLGRFEEALGAFARASVDKESFSLATKGQGRITAAMGNHREAAQFFRAAWESIPEDFDAWVGWAGACESSGDIPAVLEAYEAFAKLNEPTAEILINWGRALEAAGEPDRALNCFTEAIKRDPASPNAYFNCGDLLYRHGSPSDAAHLYEVGLRYAPANSEAWFTYGNALAKSGLSSRAAEAYRQALEHNPHHNGAKHNLSIVTEPKTMAA